MKISFLGQPLLSHGGWAASFIERLLADQAFDRLDVAVAWMKRSGLSRIEQAIRGFRERGGTASVIVGIDEGGATAQGLRLALQLFDSVCVFHDPGPGRRTYHPKVYLATGDSAATLLVGSNNATAGGLFSNYEGSLACELDLHAAADLRLLKDVRSWFHSLYSDAAVCLPLDDKLLETLISDARYRVGDEDRMARRRAEGDEDYDGVAADPPGDSVFGASSTAKAGLAPSVRGAAPPPPRSRRRQPVAAAPTAAAVTHRWWKRLTPTDAQKKKAGTNPTGKLHLTKAGHDIDHTTYFRHELFSSASWLAAQKGGKPGEETRVTFDVVIDGTPRGRYQLLLDHADHRIARQGNAATWLHWGPLGPILVHQDYSGAWVTIERWDDGSYRLSIQRTPPAAQI